MKSLTSFDEIVSNIMLNVYNLDFGIVDGSNLKKQNYQLGEYNLRKTNINK